MSGDEPFLARWSRRKHEAATPKDQGEPAPTLGPAERNKPVPDIAADLPLPPIESIQAASDLKPFLAPTVPLELTRAALRRAWTADPAIRDFVGLSENAWDFNAPNGVPGFGSVTLDDVRRLVADMTNAADAAEPARGDPQTVAPDPAPAPERPHHSAETSPAGQPEEERKGAVVPPPSRRHGGALPT